MPHYRRFVINWMYSLCALIVGMVVVGGITRLTGSGLSIVDWNPVMGALPPLSESAWREAFNRYQQFPQFKIVNAAMSLGDFKHIFFWEYLHRLLGRLIGACLLLPLLYLMMRRALDRSLALKIFGAFVLGGLQGLLGWLMVKSGLVDRPEVSHYRLAAHLTLALIVLAYLFRIALHLTRSGEPKVATRFHAVRALPVLVLLQIIYGAFVAGLHAGHAYNTFPKMNGEWIPGGAFALSPGWLNCLENPATVQLIHRSIACVIVMVVFGFAAMALRTTLSRLQRLSVLALLAATSLQFFLGVMTLVFFDPVALAVLHQLGATILFLASLWVGVEFQAVGSSEKVESSLRLQPI